MTDQKEKDIAPEGGINHTGKGSVGNLWHTVFIASGKKGICSYPRARTHVCTWVDGRTTLSRAASLKKVPGVRDPCLRSLGRLLN